MVARLLIVDDEDMLLRSLSRLLGRDHEVETAGSGESALAKLRAGLDVDLVLSDYQMGGINGLQLYDQAKAELGDRSPAFLFMSGSSATLDLYDGAKQRGLRVLAKPCESETLRRSIAEALGV